MKKKLIVILLPIITLISFLSISKVYLFLSQKIFIPCILYTFTGFLCPGCGATRCVKALLKGNLPRAFINNPIIFLLLVFIILLYVQLFLKTFFKPKKIIPENKYFYFVLSGIIIIFFILRNFISCLQPVLIKF